MTEPNWTVMVYLPNNSNKCSAELQARARSDGVWPAARRAVEQYPRVSCSKKSDVNFHDYRSLVCTPEFWSEPQSAAVLVPDRTAA
ncbi:hypothetical protein EVAR_64597_1 [Eumeta japonica]|uniref:Uncharacterized protein n=1 Tax=Eumeta variegata TaxID=151549 RepID=A0A4C1Z725_EUMVA|nr:hypothetical protein EVAR_64597_1 [Eumeta japonica]